jgi:hypothetical protein
VLDVLTCAVLVWFSAFLQRKLDGDHALPGSGQSCRRTTIFTSVLLCCAGLGRPVVQEQLNSDQVLSDGWQKVQADSPHLVLTCAGPCCAALMCAVCPAEEAGL